MGFVNFRLEETSGQSNTATVITELGIGNFKAFGETQRVPVKPLTLIFGANSSGKSSILHGLLLAHHGMESGEYDVHQTVLAGEMVDLGGFLNYVHKHDPSGAVVVRFETRLDRNLVPELHGAARERKPFREFSRFGLVLHIGFPPANSLPDGTQRRPLIRMVEILIDGTPALKLSSDGPLLQAQPISHPLLERALRAVFDRSFPKEVPSILSSLLADNTAVAPQGTHLIADELKDQPSPPTSDRTSEGEFGHLKEVFSKVLAGRPFLLDRLVLVDIGPYANIDPADGREWVERRDDADGTLTGFFDAHREEDSEEWWPEAQAVQHNFSKVIGFCTARIAEALRGVSYLGPMRFVPPRHFTALGIRDPRLVAGGSAAWELLCRDTGIIEVVNKWLGRGHLATPYCLKAKQLLDADRVREALRESGSAEQKLNDAVALTELMFEDTLASTIVSHRDVGFGVGQVLPILVNACALKDRLIAIEQPESQLHPAQQAELGDVFIESALGERKNTFLLETHSEHLILRVLRRVRETTEGKLPVGTTPVRPEDVSVVFIDPTSQGSVVRQLPVTPDGDFGAPWPGGFFADRLADLP
jgi:predicted ATPase